MGSSKIDVLYFYEYALESYPRSKKASVYQIHTVP